MKKRIFAPGSPVKCGINNGFITTVSLREDFIGYQVSWWIGPEKRLDNFSPCELTAVPTSTYMSIESEPK